MCVQHNWDMFPCWSKYTFITFFIIINYAASKIFVHILSRINKLYMSWTSRCSLFHFVRMTGLMDWMSSLFKSHSWKGSGLQPVLPSDLVRSQKDVFSRSAMGHGGRASFVSSLFLVPSQYDWCCSGCKTRQTVELSPGNVPVWWASGVMLGLCWE